MRQPNNLVGLTEMEHHHGPRRRGQKPCEIPLKEYMINRLRENRECVPPLPPTCDFSGCLLSIYEKELRIFFRGEDSCSVSPGYCGQLLVAHYTL